MIKMGRTIFTILFSCVFIVMTNCTSDFVENPDYPTKSEDAILHLEINKDGMTRGINENTSFNKGDEVFVVVSDRNHPEVLIQTAKATYDGDKWVMDKTIYLSAISSGVDWSTVDVSVYYPYDKVSKGFDIETGKITLINDFKTDILYGSCFGISKNDSTARITCQHAMACITFMLKNCLEEWVGHEYFYIKGPQDFLGKSITLDSSGVSILDYTETCFLRTGVYSIKADETKQFDFFIPSTVAAYDSLLNGMKNQVASENTLRIESGLDRNYWIFQIDVNAWEQGKQYIYPVNIVKDYTIPL